MADKPKMALDRIPKKSDQLGELLGSKEGQKKLARLRERLNVEELIAEARKQGDVKTGVRYLWQLDRMFSAANG